MKISKILVYISILSKLFKKVEFKLNDSESIQSEIWVT